MNERYLAVVTVSTGLLNAMCFVCLERKEFIIIINQYEFI